MVRSFLLKKKYFSVKFILTQLFTPAATVYAAEVELTKQNKNSSFHFVCDNFAQLTPALRKHYLLLIDKKVK